MELHICDLLTQASPYSMKPLLTVSHLSRSRSTSKADPSTAEEGLCALDARYPSLVGSVLIER